MIHETLEEQLSTVCPACGKEHHAKLFSLFVEDRHYVIGDCSRCGYHIEFEESELGMGLFLPDGEPVSERFRQAQTGHMKGCGEGGVEQSFSRMKFRFVKE